MTRSLDKLEQSVSAFAEATSVDELRSLFMEAIEPLGYHLFDAYSGDPETLMSPDRPGNYVLWNNYAYGVLQDFVNRGLAEICPILMKTNGRLIPFDLVEILRNAKRNKSAKWQLDILAEYGIAHAWNVPVPCAGRLKGVNVYMLNDVMNAAEQFQQSRHQIHVLALYFFSALEKMWDEQPGVTIGPADDQAVKLSPRQKECLTWCAKGFVTKDIANTMGLSENTVRYHLKEAYRKLDAGGRSEAVAVAARLGMV